MAKEVKESKLIHSSIFINTYIYNVREKFYMEKKYGGQEKTKEEWESICKEEDIKVGN